MIKNLTYISKININKKGMDKLFKELVNSIKFSFQENENNIKYEDYYFNGVPIPYDIECKENVYLSYINAEIFWKCDFKNIDKNKVKYKVEIKNENENFKQVYEGEKDNCIINQLEKNINYQIRICIIYNNSCGLWSDEKVIKFESNIDSTILFDSKRGDEFLKYLYEWSTYKRMELIYRGTRDGMYSKNFHEKCDNKGPTITLFRNDKGNIFGGFCPISWKNTGDYQNENKCFIFTLTNIYNIKPTKFASRNSGNEIFFSSGNGPCFYVTWNYDDFINRSAAYFGDHYQDTTGKGNSMFTGNTDNNNRKIIMNEVEVFKIYK